ncbi:uncharacterized protein LOC134529991 [Bacillus rossius redtenbacheri]|uniref:uncharacterized protein LOC134529991 n=1 Tax=Bacillus rossius redtenbacheri TaxID=93214 RepID=UPI002FDCFA5F
MDRCRLCDKPAPESTPLSACSRSRGPGAGAHGPVSAVQQEQRARGGGARTGVGCAAGAEGPGRGRTDRCRPCSRSIGAGAGAHGPVSAVRQAGPGEHAPAGAEGLGRGRTDRCRLCDKPAPESTPLSACSESAGAEGLGRGRTDRCRLCDKPAPESTPLSACSESAGAEGPGRERTDRCRLCDKPAPESTPLSACSESVCACVQAGAEGLGRGRTDRCRLCDKPAPESTPLSACSESAAAEGPGRGRTDRCRLCDKPAPESTPLSACSESAGAEGPGRGRTDRCRLCDKPAPESTPLSACSESAAAEGPGRGRTDRCRLCDKPAPESTSLSACSSSRGPGTGAHGPVSAAGAEGPGRGRTDRCRLCDKPAPESTPLSACTTTTKIRMHQKLAKIVSVDRLALRQKHGVLCSRCARLLNYVDRIQVELGVLKKTIVECIHKKHNLFVPDQSLEAELSRVEEASAVGDVSEMQDTYSGKEVQTSSRTKPRVQLQTRNSELWKAVPDSQETCLFEESETVAKEPEQTDVIGEEGAGESDVGDMEMCEEYLEPMSEETASSSQEGGASRDYHGEECSAEVEVDGSFSSFQIQTDETNNHARTSLHHDLDVRMLIEELTTDTREDDDADRQDGGDTESGQTVERDGELTVESDGDRTVERDGDRTVEREGEQTVERDGDRTVEREGEQTVEREGEQTVESDGDRTVERDGDRTVERDGERTVERDGDRTVERDGDRTVEREGDRTVERDGDRTVESDGDQTVERDGDRTVEREGEQTVEREGEQTVEREGEQTVERDGDRTVERDGDRTVERDGEQEQGRDSELPQVRESQVGESAISEPDKGHESTAGIEGSQSPSSGNSWVFSGMDTLSKEVKSCEREGIPYDAIEWEDVDTQSPGKNVSDVAEELGEQKHDDDNEAAKEKYSEDASKIADEGASCKEFKEKEVFNKKEEREELSAPAVEGSLESEIERMETDVSEGQLANDLSNVCNTGVTNGTGKEDNINTDVEKDSIEPKIKMELENVIEENYDIDSEGIKNIDEPKTFEGEEEKMDTDDGDENMSDEIRWSSESENEGTESNDELVCVKEEVTANEQPVAEESTVETQEMSGEGNIADSDVGRTMSNEYHEGGEICNTESVKENSSNLEMEEISSQPLQEDASLLVDTGNAELQQHAVETASELEHSDVQVRDSCCGTDEQQEHSQTGSTVCDPDSQVSSSKEAVDEADAEVQVVERGSEKRVADTLEEHLASILAEEPLGEDQGRLFGADAGPARASVAGLQTDESVIRMLEEPASGARGHLFPHVSDEKSVIVIDEDEETDSSQSAMLAGMGLMGQPALCRTVGDVECVDISSD